MYMVLTNPHGYETQNWIHHYEDIYEKNENLSKFTPVYGNRFTISLDPIR